MKNLTFIPTRTFSTAFALILVLCPLLSQASELSLKDFLQQSWQQNPMSAVGNLQDQESAEFKKSGEGRYMPHLSVEAIDSTGFPGSTSTLRVGGLMGSSYRKGLGAGVIWDQMLYDFGRTSSLLKKYQADNEANAAQISREKYELIGKLSSLYLTCSRARSQMKSDAHLIQLGELIAKETSKMTDTGQKTLVDQSLTKIDVEDLKLEESDLKQERDLAAQEMGIYISRSDIECSELVNNFSMENYGEFKVKPPHILLAKAQRQSAEALAESMTAEQRPILTATGSYGYLQEARLVTKDDYSVGVGFIFPFYNGGEDRHKEAAYRLRSEVQDKELEIAQLEFKAHIKKLDSRIDQLEEEKKILEGQGQEAEKTMQLALRRYLRLQGTLVDVRESFKRLRSVELNKVKVAEELISVSFERQILDTSGT